MKIELSSIITVLATIGWVLLLYRIINYITEI